MTEKTPEMLDAHAARNRDKLEREQRREANKQKRFLAIQARNEAEEKTTQAMLDDLFGISVEITCAMEHPGKLWMHDNKPWSIERAAKIGKDLWKLKLKPIT